MKYFLFFILAVTSFLTACEEEKENDNCVPSEQKTIKCDTNDDCTDYYNSNYYCNYSQLEDNKNCQSKFCFIDECKTSNINCGLGTCISEANYHICKCDENAVLKYFAYNERFCVENKCQSKEDCESIYFVDEYENHIALNSCSSQGKCVNVCENDFDCIGKDEVCFNGYYVSHCVDYNYVECAENYYSSPYGSMHSNYCEKKCDENNPCNPGFVCNNENQHCLPICFSDEDCLKDKFSKGNKCSLDLYYCVE